MVKTMGVYTMLFLVNFLFTILYIDIVLNMISKKLTSGGLFIGTAMDGDIIKIFLIMGN